MEKASLFEHNEIAYQKLVEMLKKYKTATIDHATGTGKSFIALKYLYENKDKKFLYLAPTYPIIEQLKQSTYKIGLTPEDINIDTMIYRSLLQLNMKNIYEQYDGIIFDEYHRTGAPETYKRIKELKLLLKQGNDDKKFIGLTATPIRYLDKERNMTKEVFDNHVASKLSLSEAMLEELLPVPLYINSKIACREQFEKLIKKINKLASIEERNEYLERVKPIANEIDNGDKDINTMLKKYITSNNGKYIIFCDRIDRLEKYASQVGNWFNGIGSVNTFKVHSGQDKEKNQKELNKFNDAKDDLSVLLCVDILNEGVHVNDIDGVILLRKTQSPIIYFQQIGRALSFSGRKKQIKIFDLVNNFGNHNAIDAVYQEFEHVMQRKITENPDKKEKYREILSRFKIMDETREIIQNISKIDKEITPEKIILSRIQHYTDLLVSSSKSGRIDVFGDKELKKAYIYISHYSKFITNNQFKKLMNTNIILPESLLMSWEERQVKLLGYDSFYEKELKQNEVYFRMLNDFIKRNGRMPRANSNDIDEQMLNDKYYSMLPSLNGNQITQLVVSARNAEIEFSTIEKSILEQKLSNNDFEILVKTGNTYIDKNFVMPEYISVAIEKAYLNYTCEWSNDLGKIIEENKKLIQEKKLEVEKQRYVRMKKIMDFITENPEASENELINVIQTTEGALSTKDLTAIKRKFSDIKKEKTKLVINEDGTFNMKEFCLGLKGISSETVFGKIDKLLKTQADNLVLKQVLEFMMEHEGKLPNMNSENQTERKLAMAITEIENFQAINDELLIAEKDFFARLYDPSRTMLSLVNEKIEKNEAQINILKYIEFFRKNGRKPLNNSASEEERALANSFEEYTKELTNRDLNSILNVVNSGSSIRKTAQEYLANKLREKKGGRNSNERTK